MMEKAQIDRKTCEVISRPNAIGKTYPLKVNDLKIITKELL